MFNDLPTPVILIDAAKVRRNIDRMAAYSKQHRLQLRPHTKTHKSTRVAKMQIDAGACGLTVAKVGEAVVMAAASDDILMAYPAVDPNRCRELAEMAREKTVRVGLDSTTAADVLATAARSVGSTIGVLVDIDVGFGRTGVQSPADATALAEHVGRARGLRLDGMMFFPGQIGGPYPQQEPALNTIEQTLTETIDLWKRAGLEAKIVSGGSTPSAERSHVMRHMTEIRPGTYVYNDVNSIRHGCATIDDCAARIIATVISTAVPGQVVIDAGSKTLTSDRCGPAPDSGHGYIIEYPEASITKLSEEHGQVNVRGCSRAPKVGDRVTVIPNHICPCVNLQDNVWWHEEGAAPEPMRVDARGRVY